MSNDAKKKWKVRGGFHYPINPANKLFLGPGETFEATEEEVAPYRWMVEPVRDSEKKPKKEDASPKKENKRASKPAKYPRAFGSPPEDRAY